jgi:hypothetical protein
VGIEVVGIEVVGIEVVGIEVVGIEVVGIEAGCEGRPALPRVDRSAAPILAELGRKAGSPRSPPPDGGLAPVTAALPVLRSA